MPRVAVVGAGQIAAQKVYLPVLVALEDVELAVLVEPRRRRRQAVRDKYRFASAGASAEDVAPCQADCAFLLTRPSARLRDHSIHVLDAVRDRCEPINSTRDALKSHRLAHDVLTRLRTACGTARWSWPSE